MTILKMLISLSNYVLKLPSWQHSCALCTKENEFNKIEKVPILLTKTKTRVWITSNTLAYNNTLHINTLL